MRLTFLEVLPGSFLFRRNNVLKLRLDPFLGGGGAALGAPENRGNRYKSMKGKESTYLVVSFCGNNLDRIHETSSFHLQQQHYYHQHQEQHQACFQQRLRSYQHSADFCSIQQTDFVSSCSATRNDDATQTTKIKQCLEMK